jgi:general secretion pathway protein C
MFSNLSTFLVHFVGAALACAQLAYWSIRLTTAPPAAAPMPARGVQTREPDASLLAREFGLVETVSNVTNNIQVSGVFAAGRDSAAVMTVDDRPARAVLLGQEVVPGSTLVEVQSQGVTLESGGVRRQLQVPRAPLATVGGPAINAGFERHGNVLTAPSVEGAPTTVRPIPTRPAPAVGEPPVLRGRGPAGGSPVAQ